MPVGKGKQKSKKSFKKLKKYVAAREKNLVRITNHFLK